MLAASWPGGRGRRPGFTDVSGVDPSPGLIARGRQLMPDLRFAVLKSPPKSADGHGGFMADGRLVLPGRAGPVAFRLVNAADRSFWPWHRVTA